MTILRAFCSMARHLAFDVASRCRCWTSSHRATGAGDSTSQDAIAEAALARELSRMPGLATVRGIFVLPAKGQYACYDKQERKYVCKAYSYLELLPSGRFSNDASDVIAAINSNADATVTALKLGILFDYAHFGALPLSHPSLPVLLAHRYPLHLWSRAGTHALSSIGSKCDTPGCVCHEAFVVRHAHTCSGSGTHR